MGSTSNDRILRPENGQRNEQGIMLRIRDLMLERVQ